MSERVQIGPQQYAAQDHLGGYVPGGDPATYYPDLWRWLVEGYGVQTVIDVGCGEGHSTDFFVELGCEHVLGLDGVEQPNPYVYPWDYTKGTAPILAHFDLCWACEFVEHVEEQFIPNFLHTFAQADLVLLTHALPGQVGYHHVNMREPLYWVGVMAAIGYRLDQELTARTRALALANTEIGNHFVRSGMAFLTSAPRDKMNAERSPLWK